MKNRTAIEGLVQELRREVIERDQLLKQEQNKENPDLDVIAALRKEIDRNLYGIEALLWSLT